MYSILIIDAIFLLRHRKHLLHCATAPTCMADALCLSGLMLRTRWRHWDGKQRNIFTVNLMFVVFFLNLLQNVNHEKKINWWCIHCHFLLSISVVEKKKRKAEVLEGILENMETGGAEEDWHPWMLSLLWRPWQDLHSCCVNRTVICIGVQKEQHKINLSACQSFV